MWGHGSVGAADMQLKKTGKLHSTFLVRAVVGDLLKREVFNPRGCGKARG